MLPEDRVATLALFEIFLYVDELLQWISIVLRVSTAGYR